MPTLVLTVIGDDRAGLVKALADVIAEGGGNWERSHLSELGGKFAGIVLVTVPEDRVDALRAALTPLEGLLDVSVHDAGATPAPHEADGRAEVRHVRIELLGNDRPGIASSPATASACPRSRASRATPRWPGGASSTPAPS